MAISYANVQVTKVLTLRGNTIQNNRYTGLPGELTVDTEAKTIRIHDGVTPGGNVVQGGGGAGSYGNANVKVYLSTFDGNILPSANVTYSLGSLTRQWKDLFVSNNTIYVGGVPLTIDNTGNLTVNGNVIPTIGYVNTVVANVTVDLSSYALNANVTAANIGLKGYVDQANTIQSAQLTSANLGIIGYIDQANTIQSSQVNAANLAITAANVGMRGYVDAQTYTNINVRSYFLDGTPKTFAGNLTIEGNLFVNGNVNYISVNNIAIGDNIINLADLNPADSLDLGLTAHRTVNGLLQHTGLIRDASANQWRLFSNVVQNPGTTVDFTDAIYDDLQLGNITSPTITAINNNITAANAAWAFANTIQSQQLAAANVGIIGYIDQANTIQTAQINAANLAITAANVGMKGYVDLANSIQSAQISAANIGIIGYIDLANTIQSGQVSAANLAITAANVGMKGYVDSQTFYSNARVATYLQSGNIANISVAGNVTATYFVGNGALLTGIIAGSSYSNVQVATYLPTYSGNIANLTVTNKLTLTATKIALGYLSGLGGSGQGYNSVAVGSYSGYNTQGNSAVAIGTNTGQTQGDDAVAIGTGAGGGQGTQGVAIGFGAGQTSQTSGGVAVGYAAGQTSQGLRAVAIGRVAGNDNQGARSVAIGDQAGYSYQPANSIEINASGTPLNYANLTAGLYITSVKNDTANVTNAMYYNTTTNEITYGPASGGSYSNVQVATYLPTYSGNVANIRLGVSGVLTFPDGTTQTTASSSYSNVQAESFITTFSGNVPQASLAYSVNISPVILNQEYHVAILPAKDGAYGVKAADGTANVTYNPVSNRLTLANIVATNITVGNIANIRLGVSGVLTFPDGTTMITASAGGGSSYSNVNVAVYLPTYGGTIQSSNVQTTTANIQTTTAATNPATGALRVMGGVGVAGAVVAGQLNSTGNLIANAVSAYSLNTVANVTASVINAGTINSSGNVLAQNIIGTIATASQPSITAVGTLATLSVTGNATVGNLVGSEANTRIIANTYVTTFDIYGNVTFPGNITVGGLGITMPTRPAFRVNGTSLYGGAQSTANVNLKGVAVSTAYNQGSYFDATTGKFTAPVAGIYEVLLNARVNGSFNGLAQLVVLKNGLNSAGNIVAFWETTSNTAGATHFGVSGTVVLATGDYLSANILVGNVTFDQNDNWSVTYLG